MKCFFVTMTMTLFLFTGTLHAAVKSTAVEYEFEGTKLKGYLYHDDAIKGKRPGVMVVHEFWGLDDDAKHRAEMLAELGYVGFACDMYGVGKLAEHPDDARKFAGEVRANIATWRGRALAGLKILQSSEHCDATKVAAIGYCFGGSTVMQIAYSGADVSAVVSFHGALVVPTEEQTKATKAKMLICHGAEDPLILEENCQKFRAALSKGGVDYQMVYYGGAVHSFTVKGADKRNMKGIGYNEKADKRSWQAMQDLFKEAFGEKK
jgi:dienelactone hydrolase